MAILVTKYSKTQKRDVHYIAYWYKELDEKGVIKRKRKWIKIGTSKTKAEKALKEFEKAQKDNPCQFNKKKSFNLSEFIESEFLPWSKSSKSKKEHEDTSRSLKRFMEFTGQGLNLDQVDERHMERYKTWRKQRSFQTSYHQESVSNRTVNLDIRIIKQCFAKAVKWGILDKSSIADVSFLSESKGRVRFFSLEEIDRLVEASNLYIKRLFLFGINTGMRMSEILNTRLSDIDFDNNLIHIRNRKSFKTKSRKDRSIPIPPQLQKLLPQYMETYIHFQSMTQKKRLDIHREYLFCVENGQKIRCFRKAFKTLLRRAEISDASIHTMRHTYASHLVMSGVSLRVVKDLLGHANISTTMIYSHLSPEHLQKAVLSLPFDKD